jgi:hypothetical protein
MGQKCLNMTFRPQRPPWNIAAAQKRSPSVPSLKSCRSQGPHTPDFIGERVWGVAELGSQHARPKSAVFCTGAHRRGILSSSPAPTAALGRITRVLVGPTARAKRGEVAGVVAAARRFGHDVIDGRGQRQAPSAPARLAEVVVSSEHERSELPPPRPVAPGAGALAVVVPWATAMLGAGLAGAHQPGAEPRAARPLRRHRHQGVPSPPSTTMWIASTQGAQR